MAQQPDQTNPSNREDMLTPHSGVQHVEVPKRDDIQIKVNPGGTGAQDAASEGYRAR